jgi:hypothetical protein
MTQDPSKQSAQVAGMQADWGLVRVLLGGTAAIREAGERYLPKNHSEEREAYEARLKSSTLFPGFSRTVKTLAAKPFSKALAFGDDVPEQIQEYCEDVDLEGQNLHAFSSKVMQNVLAYGLHGVLVDFPPVVPARNLEEERQTGARPYFVSIKAEQLLGWRASRVGGRWVIDQLRYMEAVDEPDGEFADACIKQVRVLEPGKWRTFRMDARTQKWVMHEEGVTSLPYVPFVPFYGERTGFMSGKPPLIELAHLNVEHWQSASDQRNILHVARVPILAVIGDIPETFSLAIGSSGAANLPAGCDMKFVEHTGQAIGAGKEDLEALEERMRQAGAELLVLKRGNATATEIATDNAIGMCALQEIVQSFEDSLDQCLQIMADWVRLPEGGHVTVFNDFGAASLADASAELLLKAQQGGIVSKPTFINEMKRRGILSAEVDAEDESERIAEDGPSLGDMVEPVIAGDNQGAS